MKVNIDETIMYLRIENEKLRQDTDQYKAERDTLIDDIAVLKANNDRYRKRTENAMDYAERSQCEVLRLESEKEKLQGRLDEFLEHDYDNQKLYKENRNLLSEISQHIGNKPSSSTYKYFRAKLDELGIKEGE